MGKHKEKSKHHRFDPRGKKPKSSPRPNNNSKEPVNPKGLQEIYKKVSMQFD